NFDKPVTHSDEKFSPNDGLAFADQHDRPGFIKLNPVHFQLMIENADSRLRGFFDQMIKALIPNERSPYKKQEAKKTVVSFCYMMANVRNMFVNSFELEVGLYLLASGISSAAIDTLHNLGVSWTEFEGLKVNFNKIELLTVHVYDDAINERKEERSTKDIRLIGFQEKNLHSMHDYIDALQMVLKINENTRHLHNYVAPIVAD
ncbi:8011_t:CDS:2, partial [Scutellospora calospora]